MLCAVRCNTFIVANTGVANTPADLGPLIDGVLDVVTEKCVADFMRATDLSLMHGCACCGMRTTDCVRIQRSALAPYALTETETDAARLQDPAFTDSLNTRLSVLGNAGFVTFMCAMGRRASAGSRLH